MHLEGGTHPLQAPKYNLVYRDLLANCLCGELATAVSHRNTIYMHL